jgi:hypothetical protein
MFPSCDEVEALAEDEVAVEHGHEDDDNDVQQLKAADQDADEDALSAGVLDEAPDEFTDDLHPSAASCVGYWNGGNFCLASCWDSPGTWVAVGHITNTDYGQCGGKVNDYCAWYGGTYGACWGWP